MKIMATKGSSQVLRRLGGLPILFLLIVLFSDSPMLRAQDFELQGNHLILPSPISFKTGTSDLTPESLAAMEHIKKYLEAKTYITLLRIEGHTDGSAPGQDGQKLSEQRAMAVVRWLVAHGIDCKRLIPVGFGANKPVASNTTVEGKAQNRRIEVVNAALRSKAIGGMPVDGGGLVAGDPCQ